MSCSLRILNYRKFSADKSATAAVEFAILSPLYLLLIMGMMAYGIYFGASHSVQQLSADAARAAIAGINAAERQTLASDFIERNAGGYLLIDPDKLSVTVGDSLSVPGQFNVTVSYDGSDLPIWGLFDGLAMPSQTIMRRSTIRIGGI
ncbi:MAG: pilus assembly protein [Aquamicrobium sp.]|nr:pilus assembly protein [Aquamicrobium sp.]